nr:alpha/beta hydrolase [Candidatus Sigynarchaeota archaeon]
MVKLNEDALKPHVIEHLKKNGKQFMKNAFLYMITHGVNPNKVKELFEKLMGANDRFYELKSLDLEKIGGAFTDQEIILLLKLQRHVQNKGSMADWKRYKKQKVPAGLDIDHVDAGGVQAEWQFVPGAADDKVLLYYHGGGGCLFSPATHRILTVDIAMKAKVAVLSVDYRLLPEHTINDALEDCIRAYKWLIDRGIKPKNIIMGGDSAGGSLALVTLLQLRDAGLALPGCAVCISPVVDNDFTSEAVLANFTSDPSLGTNGTVVFFTNIHQKFPKEDIEKLTPIKASLKGLPPMLVQATTTEMLFDGCKRLVLKAKADGTQAELQYWEGLTHDFQIGGMNYYPEASEASENIATFIRGRLNT